MTDTRPLSQRGKWVLGSRKALHERTDPGTPPEQLAYSYALDISNTGVLEVDDVMEQLLNIVGYRVEPLRQARDRLGRQLTWQKSLTNAAPLRAFGLLIAAVERARKREESGGEVREGERSGGHSFVATDRVAEQPSKAPQGLR